MFTNAGKKLGSIIKVVTIIEMILIAILGFVLMAGCSEMGGPLPFIIFVAMINIEFLIWLSSLFIIGMCDMMSDVYDIRWLLVKGESTK